VTGAAATDGTFDAGDCAHSSCTTFDAAEDTRTGVAGNYSITVTDFISTCSLYHGDDLLDGPVSPTNSGSELAFNNVDFPAEAGEISRIDLRCNMADPSTTTDVFFAFDIADGAIVAEDSKGQTVDPSGDAPNGALSAPDIVLSVESQGVLATSVDSSAPSADAFVVAGTTDNLLTVLNFAAYYEDIRVDEFQLSEEAGLVDGTAGVYADNIQQLTIVYEDVTGTEVEKSASMSTSTALAKFTNLNLLVEKNEEAKIYVYADLQEHARNDGGADSNDSLNVEFEETGFDGYGLASRKDFTLNSVGIDGNTNTGVEDTNTSATFVVREAVPTIELNSLSPSGTGYVAGTNEVLVFDITVAGEEDVLIDHLVFDVDTSEAAPADVWSVCNTDDVAASLGASDFVLRNSDDESIGTATLLDTTGATCDPDANTDAGETAAYAFFSFTTPELLPAGETSQFTLSVDTSGAAANDSIQVNIPSEFFVSSSWVNTADIDTEAIAALTATSLNLDAAASALEPGDLICLAGTGDTTCDATDEIMLVVDPDTSVDAVTVVRGYRDSIIAAVANAENVLYSTTPTSFMWQDDGSDSTSSTGNDYWGAYLVEDLTVSGRPLQF
jgi:hypothetical protein